MIWKQTNVYGTFLLSTEWSPWLLRSMHRGGEVALYTLQIPQPTSPSDTGWQGGHPPAPAKYVRFSFSPISFMCLLICPVFHYLGHIIGLTITFCFCIWSEIQQTPLHCMWFSAFWNRLLWDCLRETGNCIFPFWRRVVWAFAVVSLFLFFSFWTVTVGKKSWKKKIPFECFIDSCYWWMCLSQKRLSQTLCKSKFVFFISWPKLLFVWLILQRTSQEWRSRTLATLNMFSSSHTRTKWSQASLLHCWMPSDS